MWFGKTSAKLSAVSADKKQQKEVRKIPKIRKTSIPKW